MPGLTKTVRFAAIGVATLVICISLAGVSGAWFVNGKASDIVLKGFGAIDIGVGIVDAGIARVDNLITRSRTEVRQATETIIAVGGQRLANRPVLNALNERLDTTLTPRIAQMRQTLAPVRDALLKVSNAVEFVSSLPTVAERAPRLAALDEAFDRLEGLSADATQLRTTLRTLVEQNSDVSAETSALLNALTQRIDKRLGEVQENVEAVRAQFDTLQVRMDKRKARLLFLFNLAAMLSTLMLSWIIYTQIIVIRHHWARVPR